MGYFPFYMDIAGKRCLIVGGGTVALRKAEKLLPFAPQITVIAPEICGKMRQLPVECIMRSFTDSDLNGAFMVIAATNDAALNRRIYQICTEQKILINTVDDIENCSFIFPALVHCPPVTVGICTGGSSPVFAKYLRQMIEDDLDDRTLEIAEILSRFRPIVKQKFDTESARKSAMEAILAACLASENLPDDAEITELLESLHI